MKRMNELYIFDNHFAKEQMRLPAGEMLQITELSIASGSEIVEHTQWCDEITFFIQGSGHVISDGVISPVCKGSVHFIKSGVNHKICADEGENLRFFCVGFFSDMSNPTCKFFHDSIGNVKYFLASDTGNIKYISELLIREFYSYDEASFDSVSRYFEQLLTDCARCFLGKFGSVKGNYIGGKKNDAIYKTLRFIDREYIGVTSVKEICDNLSYSEFYLSHLFREKMNMSIKEYLMRKKIAHAEEMLSTTDLSVEAVSEYFGFSSSHSFRRVFKQYTGSLPSAKKQHVLQ